MGRKKMNNRSDRDLVNESVKNTYYEKEDEEEQLEEEEDQEESQAQKMSIPYFKILSILCFLLAIGFLFVGKV